MKRLLVALFWIGATLVAYTYFGYGALVWVILKLRKRQQPPAQVSKLDLPSITVVVPAYNEATCIVQKLENTLELDYPRDRLHVIFVDDNSTDDTLACLRTFNLPADVAVQVLHQPERRGKLAALERALAQVTTPIVVFTDASAMLNPGALRALAHPFADPTVGAVTGEKRVVTATKAGAEGTGEGLYWRYESLLKRLDGELHSVVGAGGELFAARTTLCERVPGDTIIEDFYLSLRIAQHGFRVAYAPDAAIDERHSASMGEEWKRKVRIAAGGLQAICRLPGLFNLRRHRLLTFQYVSHRVFRWTLAPLFLPVIFVTNGLLAWRGGWFYRLLYGAQLLFYGAAACGFGADRIGVRVKLLYIPFYFCMMNLAVYAGAWRLVRGTQSQVWDKARRTG